MLPCPFALRELLEAKTVRAGLVAFWLAAWSLPALLVQLLTLKTLLRKLLFPEDRKPNGFVLIQVLYNAMSSQFDTIMKQNLIQRLLSKNWTDESYKGKKSNTKQRLVLMLVLLYSFFSFKRTTNHAIYSLSWKVMQKSSLKQTHVWERKIFRLFFLCPYHGHNSLSGHDSFKMRRKRKS